MNHRILASFAVVLVAALAACEEKKTEAPAAPAVTVNVTATATGAAQPVQAAAGHPTPAATPTTSAATGLAGNGKSVGVNTGVGGSNVNLQNGQKAGSISTTPGNVQIQGAGGGINIPTGGGLPTKAP